MVLLFASNYHSFWSSGTAAGLQNPTPTILEGVPREARTNLW